LLEQLVDQRCLAVINMRNDGDVSYMLYVGHFRVFGWRGGGL
jgi:hypothetical protein